MQPPTPAGAYLTRHLRDHPDEAGALLDSALLFAVGEGNLATFLHALRMAAEARGWSEVATEAGVTPEDLDRALNAGAAPDFRTITAVLAAMGLRLTVTDLTAEDAAYAAAGV